MAVGQISDSATRSQVQGFNRMQVPDIPKPEDELKEPFTYIYNVSTEMHVLKPGYATYVVPPIKKGQVVSDPCLVPYRKVEWYDDCSGMRTMRFRTWEGPTEAKLMMGESSTLPGPVPETTNFLYKGVFPALSPNAANGVSFTPEELVSTEEGLAMIEAAKARMRDWYQRILRDADRRFAIPATRNQIYELDIRACNALGQTREWAKPPETNVPCPACGKPLPENAILHSVNAGGCGAVLDVEKALKFGLLSRDEAIERNLIPAEAPKKGKKTAVEQE